MGFGQCLLQPTSNPKPGDASRKRRKPRVHCDSFYWDISSVLAKTLCLATFFVAESPRRIVSYITRKPEPKPFFICSRWGYRMCACGHHYYEHEDVPDSAKFFSTAQKSDQPSVITNDATAASGSTKDNGGGIAIKGGSFKDIIERIAEQAAANQKTESPTDSATDSPPDSAASPTPPETSKQKKRRRRWYWPF